MSRRDEPAFPNVMIKCPNCECMVTTVRGGEVSLLDYYIAHAPPMPERYPPPDVDRTGYWARYEALWCAEYADAQLAANEETPR